MNHEGLYDRVLFNRCDGEDVPRHNGDGGGVGVLPGTGESWLFSGYGNGDGFGGGFDCLLGPGEGAPDGDGQGCGYFEDTDGDGGSFKLLAED